jgi:hypothetical protein
MFLAIANRQFRIKTPTAFMTIQHDRTHLTIAPIGAVVSVEDAEGEGLINVVWNGKKFMMFADDLQSRAERFVRRPSTEVAERAA